MNFIGGISAITIAVACAKWYFTPEGTITAVSSLTVFRSYGITMRYHWGTAAFGSLLIAVVQFIRSFLLYVQKQYNKHAAPCTKTLVAVLCCIIQCWLWCLECCLKFISKNAYIQTAIHVMHC